MMIFGHLLFGALVVVIPHQVAPGVKLEAWMPFECPMANGLFPDPEDCSMFYDCANGRPYHESCAAGTMYDEDMHICNFSDQVHCGDRPRPGSTRPPTPDTTSSAPTTTTTKPITSATSEPITTATTEPITTATTDTTTRLPATTTSPWSSTEGPTPSESTSQPGPTTTTVAPSPGPGPNGLPRFVLGMYILLADDTEEGFHTDSDSWTPKLHQYQQDGANVLFFTFINPATMDVPIAFKKLAATRGTDSDGAVPADTTIIFAIGGYAYSIKPNPWEWLTSKGKAEAMAEQVAGWRAQYGIEGVDLDLEEGAGSRPEAGPNMVHFIRKLKALQPGFLVTQPTYGYPQITAEIDVINASWNVGATSNGLADSIGLMVYEGTQALQYVKNYAEGSSQWEGFPIQVDVPRPEILLGCKGSSGAATIDTLAKEAVRQDLMGVMVWFCSVRDGLVYGNGWDCSGSESAMGGYVAALQYFNDHM